MEKKKILILMSGAGGHSSVALALKEAFEKKGHKVVFYDAVPKIFWSAYTVISRYFLSFWGFLFWASNVETASKIIVQISDRLFNKKVAKKVKQEVPDFIISDYPFITKLEEKVFSKNGHVPMGVVVVDPVTVHAVWFRGHPDFYFLPTKEVFEMAVEAGVPEKKLIYAGYPVKADFYKDEEKNGLRKYLGLEKDIFTLMIGGSSEGVGKIADLCEMLEELPAKYKFQAVVVCGKNKQLFRKLSTKYYFNNRFKVLGYERQMDLWIRAVDVVVSKAGPTNLYETVAARKPFLAFSYMPGQEEGNVAMINKEKLGMVEEDIEKVTKILKKWVVNPRLLLQYNKGIEKVREEQKEASNRIVEFVERYKKI